jgi:hypothetical protein
MPLHRITEKYCKERGWGIAGNAVEDLDRILRTELEKMAKELHSRSKMITMNEIYECLGLEEVSEHIIEPDDSHKYGQVVGETPKSEKWCECQNGKEDHDKWNYCPWCGTPRPVEKSLVDVVAEAIDKRMNGAGSMCWGTKAWSELYAEAAIEAYRKYEGEK